MSYSAAIDRMMASLRPRLPGVLDAAIQNELFIVVDEFLKGSLAWKECLAITTQVGVQEYDFDPDVNSIVFELISSYQQTNPTPTTSPWDEAGSIRVPASMPVPGSLFVQTPPSQVITFQIKVALTVNSPVSTDGYPILPTWLCDRYAQSAWLDGVLGKMMSQPAKPYSNQQMAVYHLRRFRTGMAMAKVDSLHDNTYRGQRWMYPQSFATRRRHG
jgi:hypothetical protein